MASGVLHISMVIDYRKRKDDPLENISKMGVKKFKEDSKAHYNVTGTLFSIILRGCEDSILRFQTECTEDAALTIGVLMFDDPMIANNDAMLDDEFLRHMESFCSGNTAIDVQLACKSTDTEWKPEAPEENDPESVCSELKPAEYSENCNHDTQTNHGEKLGLFNDKRKVY